MATSENPSVVNTMCISSFHYTHVITFRKLQLNKRGDWRRQTAKMKCDIEKKWNRSGCTTFALSASWSHGLLAQFVRMSDRVSGCGFKSHSSQHSVATSENLSLVNPICISWFSKTHVIKYRKLRLNKRGDWRTQTAEIKCDTGQMMKLEWLYKIGSEWKLKPWPNSSVC